MYKQVEIKKCHVIRKMGMKQPSMGSSITIQLMSVSDAKLIDNNYEKVGTSELYNIAQGSEIKIGGVYKKEIKIRGKGISAVAQAYKQEMELLQSRLDTYYRRFYYPNYEIPSDLIQKPWLDSIRKSLKGDDLIFDNRITDNPPVAKEQTKWTDNSNINKIDPFILQLEITNGNKQKWVITTQMTHSATGYITKITDGEKGVEGICVSEKDFNKQKALKKTGNNGYIYSAKHEYTGNDIATDLAKKGNIGTRGGYATRLDAISKLFAEGARFNPVSLMGTEVKENTKFYTETLGKNKIYPYITYKELTQRWAELGKRYDTTTKEIKEYIDAKFVQQTPSTKFQIKFDKNMEPGNFNLVQNVKT